MHPRIRTATSLCVLGAMLAAPLRTDAMGPGGPQVQMSAAADGFFSQPDVAVTDRGAVLVAWRRSSPLGAPVRTRAAVVRAFATDLAPLGPAIELAEPAEWPRVATLGGVFVAVWRAEGIRGQLVSTRGDLIGDSFTVSESPAAYGASLATAPDGGFVVVWADEIPDLGPGFTGNRILGRAFDSLARPLAPEFVVADDPEQDDFPAFQLRPQAAFGDDGELMASWELWVCGYVACGTLVLARSLGTAERPPEPAFGIYGSAYLGSVLAAPDPGEYVVLVSPLDTFDRPEQTWAVLVDADGMQGEPTLLTSQGRGLGEPDAAVGPGTVVIVGGLKNDRVGGLVVAEGGVVGELFPLPARDRGEQHSPRIDTVAAEGFLTVWADDVLPAVDGQGESIQARYLGPDFRFLIFEDGFESGDTDAWEPTPAAP